MAEGRATVAETYERWYLRLRDGDSGDVSVMQGPTHDMVLLCGEDLDLEMEDWDAIDAKMKDDGGYVD